jgi:hypothetical protein
LFRDPSIQQSLDKRQAGSIGAGWFGSVELYEAVVDLEPCQGSHDMFDEFDGRLSVGNRRSALSGDDVFQSSGNGIGASLVKALKANPEVFVGGQKRQRDIRARQETKALVDGRSVNGALMSLIHDLSRYSITMVD